MIWKNKGHEFDELGRYMKKTNKIYFYGCAAWAKPMLEQTEWALKQAGYKENEIEILFVDRDTAKQRKEYCGKEVISPNQFYEEFEFYYGIVVMCINEANSIEVWNQFEKHGIIRRFHAYSAFEFHRYMSIFLYYRNEKIYFHLIDMFVHTHCNINCRNCFIQTYRGVRKRVQIEELKKNIDLIFKKADFVGVVVFGIGDAFCGAKEIEYAVKYVIENYSEHFMTVELVTNGTVIPTNSLLECIKHKKVRIAVDDYREHVELAKRNYEKVIEVLQKNGVNYSGLLREYWYESNFGLEKTAENEKQLCNKYWNCINEAKGFPYIGYKEGTSKMYSCVFQTINAYLHLVDDVEDDGMDLETTAPIEIIEFLLGYSDKGYLTGCTKCTGMLEGVECNHVPVAEQILKKDYL